MIYLAYILFGVVLSWLLTGAVRRYSLSNKLLDIPNVRSSHEIPTPRGGGIAIVLVTLLFSLMLWWQGQLSSHVFWVIVVSGGLIAVIGWLDDLGHVSVVWRLLIHFMAAIWALVWMGGLPPLNVMGTTFDIGWAGHIAAVIYIVWLLNLYNFMDGINGIAAIEAVTVGFCGAMLLVFTSSDNQLWILSILLVSSVAGFLFWNFPKAKIFMGDVGSAFLGLMFGIFTIQSMWVSSQLLWCWFILLGVFIVDATFTLLRRLFSGEKIYQAHCSHAYQNAARQWGHTRVTLVIALTNMAWLFPLAFLAYRYPAYNLYILIVAFIPLIYVAIILGAGKRDISNG